MQRILTAAVLLPLALAAVFLLPAALFLAGLVVVVGWAAFEYLRLTRRWAPQAPLGWLLVLVPASILALAPDAWGGGAPPTGAGALLVAGTLLFVGLPTIVLVGRTPIHEAVPAIGILAFGLPYFVVPAVSLYRLWALDVSALLLLLAVVWLGDSAAYYFGSRWGRHRLAPVVSPKKSWEGAVANLVVAVAAGVVWSVLCLGRVDPRILAVTAVTSVAAQVGDLVESLIKRAAHVKDSGALLPGHGGVLDRVDALLFAAPVMWLGLTLVGLGEALP